MAAYINDNFVSTYLKVGKFQIIGGQKVGGNVASYFCLEDGAVVHALAGPTNAGTLKNEARWALDIRKSAKTVSTSRISGDVNWKRFASHIRHAHAERFHDRINTVLGDRNRIPVSMPLRASKEAQTHWLLAKQPLAQLDVIYPVVWERILNERLSALPVARR